MVTPRWRIPRPARLPLRMKVIVGLGNPGREYEHTRHNVGWWLVDHLARHWHCDPWRKDGDAVTTQGMGESEMKEIGSLIGRAVRDALPELEGQGFFELLDGVYAGGESSS